MKYTSISIKDNQITYIQNTTENVKFTGLKKLYQSKNCSAGLTSV